MIFQQPIQVVSPKITASQIILRATTSTPLLCELILRERSDDLPFRLPVRLHEATVTLTWTDEA